MLLQNPLELQEFNHPGALKQRCEQLPPPSSGSTSRKKKIPAPNPIFFFFGKRGRSAPFSLRSAFGRSCGGRGGPGRGLRAKSSEIWQEAAAPRCSLRCLREDFSSREGRTGCGGTGLSFPPSTDRGKFGVLRAAFGVLLPQNQRPSL